MVRGVGRLRTLVLGGAAIALVLAALATALSPAPVVAQETNLEPAPTAEPTPTAEPAPTAEPTPEPTPTSAPTPEVTPTPEITLEPTSAPTPEPTPTSAPTPEVTPTPEITLEPTSAPTPEPTEEADLAPAFSVAISGLSFNEGEEATAVTLPEAEGGDGQLTYGLAGLPEGMTFDAGTRALGGTPSQAGEFTLTYTATDEDGDQASFAIAITVEAAPVTLKQVAKPRVGSLTVARTQSDAPMAPALDVSWAPPPANGLTISWYKLRHRKQGVTAWTEDSTTIETTSFRLTGLEAGATYEVQVATGTNEQGLGDWSDTGSGRANRAPTATSAAFNGGAFPAGSVATYAESGQGALGPFFADADGDTLTYTASSQHPALLGVSLSGAAGSATLTATLLNQGASQITFTATDAFGGQVTRTATITITAKTSRSIAENSAAGTAVGAPVTGTPYNGVALTYTLEGKAADSGKFVIDSASGQISLAQGATLDYETDDAHRETETFNGEVVAKFYRGEVHYTVDGHAAVINVSVIVTDVAPVVAAPTLTRTQFSEPTDPALDVTWTAATANGTTITGYEARYRKQVAEGEEANDWTAYSGTLGATATTFNLPSREAGAIYEAQVRAVSSDEGAGPWSDTGSGRANRPPAGNGVGYPNATHPYKRSRIYNAGDRISSHFVDADGDALTYSATPAHPPLADAWTVGDSLVVAAKNAGESSVTYRASDPYGGVSADALHSFTVTADETRTVAENAAAETMLGDRVEGVPHNGETLRYTLTGELATSGHFYIKPRGRIRVKSGAVLDYETKSSYTGKVEYTVGGIATAINVTVNITDLEAGKPGTPTVTRTRFSEPSAPALDVTWTAAPGNGTTITGYEVQHRVKVAEGEEANAWTDYTVAGSDGNPTKTLPANTRSINLPNLTAGTTYEFQVRALTRLEGEGPWSDIGEGTANQPPTPTSTAFNGGTFPVDTVATYAESGQGALGPFFGDPEGDALTYSASSQHPALLGVGLSGTAGSATLTATLLNPGASQIIYTARDPYGGQVTRTTTITGTAKTSRSIAENSAAGTAVGAPVTGTPYDDGDDQTDDALSYTLKGKAKDSGKFVIDSASGQISLAQGATLDYETDDAHRETETFNGQVIAKFYRGEVHYTVDGHAAVINVNILVTDVGASKPDAPTVTRTPSAVPMNPALDVTWTAPGGGATITGYKLQYRVKVADGQTANAWTDYTVTGSDGQQTSTLPATTTSINLPDLTAGATYEFQVRALTSTEGDSDWSDIGEGRANRPPHRGIIDGNQWVLDTWYDNFTDIGKYGLRTRFPRFMDAYFTDPDADTLTFAHATENHAAINGWFDTSEGQSRYRYHIKHPTVEFITLTLTARDGYGGSEILRMNLRGTRSETWYVHENSGARTVVGRLFSRNTSNPQADANSLSLSGFPDGLFTIDADRTGQVRVARNAVLDFETTSSYTGKMLYTAGGAAAAVDITIHVMDREAGKPGTPTVTRTRFSEPSDPALDAAWTAAEANGTTITGYEVQYRVKVAEGETANAWTDYTVAGSDGNPTKTLSASTRSINLPDLTAGTTYEFQVRALTSKEGPGPWSDTGSGQANRPPAATSNPFLGGRFPVGSTADYFESGPSASGPFFSDVDGDTLTYSASAQYAGLLGVSVATVSGHSRLRVVLLNPGSSTVTYVALDPYGGSASRTVTLSAYRDTSVSVPENSAAGTAVGDPVTGTPYDDGDDQTDDSLSYTLTGEAATSGAFEIDSASGQISVKQGASLDYETKDSYTGQVEYTVQGQAATIGLTINVTDVAPGKPDAPTLTRTQFSEPTDPALDVTWTAAAANGTTITGYEAQYRKKVADGEEANAWTDYSGMLGATATTFNLPDLEAGATYEAQVRAVSSDEGAGPWSDIGEGRANRAPAATSTAFNGGTFPVGSIATYAETGQGALGVFFADADGDTLTYSAAAQHPALLGVSLSGAAGEATLTATLLNPGASKVTYTASDPYGGQVTRSVTLTGSPKTVSRSVPENSAAGTAVGDPVTGTPYDDGDDQTDDALSYTLTGAAVTAGNFEIDSASGQISVKQGASLNYESETSYAAKVHYTVDGHAAFINVTISVTDVEAGKPDAPTLTRKEFSAPSNPALDVTWTAPAANGLTITGYNAQYRKKAAEGEQAAAWTDYTIEGPDEQQISELPVTTTSITLPDLEAGATYEVQVRAVTSEEDEGPWSDIGEGRANRAPNLTSTAFNGGTFPVGSIATYAEAGQGALGVFFADADGDTLTYAASAQHPALLGVSLSGVAGSATLTATLLNPGASKVTFTASDPYGGQVTRTTTITGSPKTVDRSVPENSDAGTTVGDPVTGTPYDDRDDQTDDALSYTLTGAAVTSGNFEIDSASGQISVKQGASLNYESETSYAAKVHYTVDGHAAFINVTINVTDVEAGKPDAPTLARTTFSAPSNPALDVTWTAPAANGLTISGYNAQYRKKVADGETANAWTDYTIEGADEQQTSELPATTTSVTLPDLEAGATYEVQVRALTSEEAEGPWSDAGEGRANRPPTAGTSPLSDAGAPWNESTDFDISDKFSDADGDTLTYSASSEYVGVLTTSITGDDADTLTVTVTNPAASTVTYGVSDGYGGYASLTVEITGRGDVTRSVLENSPAGTAVGDPVTGTPYDDGDDQTNDALSYTLSGEASTSGAFVIDSATGQISVKQGASLDRETKDSYTGKVHWTVQGQAAVVNLTINVTDNNAVIASAPTVTRTTFSEPSNPALDVTWTAAEANGTTVTGYEVQYRKQVAVGETPAAWTTYTYTDSNDVETTVLPVSTLTLNLPDLEAGATYEVQVRAVSSEEGVGGWSDTGSGQANRPPTICCLAKGDSGFNRGIPWGAHRTREMVGIFSDPDGDELTYSVSAQHPGILRELSLSENVDGVPVLSLRGWNPSTSNINYTISDGYGGVASDSAPVTVIANEVRSVPENSAAGTAVGRTVAGNPYATETYTYTLSGEAATSGAFEINSATGQISVKQGATIDYETKTSYSGTVTWTVQGQAASASLTVNVTNVTGPETPAAPSVEAGEDAPASSLDVSWTAPDDLGSAITGYRVRYRAAGPTDWTEHAFSGTATETTIEGLESATIYMVQVLAINAEGESDWSASGTGVTGPVQQTAEREVPENAQAGDPVGAPVTATDPEGHALTYTVVADLVDASGNSGRSLQQTSHFVIDPTTGQIRVAPGAHLDYETAHSHELRVQATHVVDDLPDGHIVNALITVTINVTDVYEAPPPSPPVVPPTPPTPALELDPASREVAENAPGATLVGAPVAARGGNGDPLTYSLSGSGAFTIHASTGQIRVAAGAVLDHESTQSHTVTVSVTDGAANATADVTISVTDVDEPPARPQVPVVSASPDAPQTALDVTWTAPANSGPPLTGYDLRYRKQGEQGWSAHAVSGGATSTTISGLESGVIYEAQVAASNAEGTSDWSDSGTGSTRAQSLLGAPRLLSALRLVAENAPAGAAVGAPIDVAAAADATLTYSLSGSGAFTIDAATGQIRVAAGAVLDHESTQSYSVTVRVTGDANTQVRQPGDVPLDATVTVTIRVTDVDEAPPRPDAPAVVRSSSSPTSELDVTWVEPDMTGKPPVTSYDIAYREADGADWTEWRLAGSRTSTTIAGLQADTAYHVRVRARNDEGVSPWSDNGEGSTAEEPEPEEPPEPTQPEDPTPPGPTPPTSPEGPTPPGPTPPTTPEGPTPPGPTTPTTPGTPDGPDTPLGPGGPVAPGPGGPRTAPGPDGPGAPTTPNPDPEPAPSGGQEAGQPASTVGAAFGANAPAAPRTVAQGALSTPRGGLLPRLGPVDGRVAAATGAGALVLAALLAGLHALLGGLTKPLGLGTAFLIPLLVPARRRREKRGDEDDPQTRTVDALAPRVGPAPVPGSRTPAWVAGSTNGQRNGRETHSDAEAADIVHTPALFSEREGDHRRPGYVPGSRASSRIAGSTRGEQRRLGR